MQILSKCCEKPLVVVSSDEGTSYYRCSGCKYASDPITENLPITDKNLPISGELVEGVKDVYEELLEEIRSYTKEELVNDVLDNHYNNFLRANADSSQSKIIPYIGTDWRDITFSRLEEIPIGDCGEFIGFMANNKWRYPERYLTMSEAKNVIKLIDAAKTGGFKNIDINLKELWCYMQTLRIDNG